MTRVLIVTGGSRGIGAATCRLAAELGYHVAVIYRTEREIAEGVVTQIRQAGGKAHAVQADVSTAEGVRQLFAETDKLGPLGGLVNNAGMTGKSSRLDEASDNTILDTMALNVNGLIFASREAVKRMSTRHGGDGGVIVNVSSGATTIGSAGEYTWYAASKGAVDSFTLGLGREVAEEGIRVVGVAPGLTETELHARSTGEPGRVKRMTPMIPMKRPGTAEEVAQIIIFALSDAASYITATTIRVSGGR
jgi:NAD(P)-dependent dehydrogenase (short-subunit alcohol dehydrogenase family)